MTSPDVAFNRVLLHLRHGDAFPHACRVRRVLGSFAWAGGKDERQFIERLQVGELAVLQSSSSSGGLALTELERCSVNFVAQAGQKLHVAGYRFVSCRLDREVAKSYDFAFEVEVPR